MAVTLSENAAKHVANFIAKRGKGYGLRLGVRTSGCSGMAISWNSPMRPMTRIWSSRATA